ncbi:MAG: 6-phosphogluconolactonase [Pyrinomonadaceae bacterium]|nr:6-phosphogluconolactonase [Pyrinomonadaceae bacterium]
MELDTAASNVSVFVTPEQLAVAAAERFVHNADEFQKAQGRFSVALAGGRTPRRVYELLATAQFNTLVEWSRVHLFFGDERCVLPTHPDSNFAMVDKALISKVEIPAKNVHRMTGEGDPEENARLYENRLREFFAQRDWPRFDLVLLGMGADGHTASLFPESRTLEETSRWVVATERAHSGQRRITLTVPALSHAAHVIFLVTGKAKAAALAEVLGGQSKRDRLPASLIRPVDGTLEWFVDRDAASFL